MRVLITGGAGFVGSTLAVQLRTDSPKAEVVVLDSLRRRGAELNVSRLQDHGVHFVHGDIRQSQDLDDLEGTFDVLVEASAEPSVHAGLQGSPMYVLQTNLVGAIHCLEFARRRSAGVIFLSTSRVYSIPALCDLPLSEASERFRIPSGSGGDGWAEEGINESFPTGGPRSFYGVSKLAAEQILEEYSESYGVPSVIDRCGVITGPGQFGRQDQGVFSLWVAHHHFLRPLRYTGFGGRGLQVRDLLHPMDLYALVRRQIDQLGGLRADVFNVGGGLDVSTSLAEWTALCREVSGNEVPVDQNPQTNPVDIPLYVSDCRKVAERFGWKPGRSTRQIAEETLKWIRDHEAELGPIFGGRKRMSVAIVTGSSGLIGSETARFLHQQGLDVIGVDNNMRRYFFGEDGSVHWNAEQLRRTLSRFTHLEEDIRDAERMDELFRRYGSDIVLVVHAAAQPSHDWAAKEPLTDFSVNATGTLVLLEATRRFAPEAAFVYTSTNKVYGDAPNRLPLVEQPTRWEIDASHPFHEHGIDETFSIDHSLHSLFGVSKAAADLMVQEYGRYFGLKTACFRGGCLTGPAHSGAELHGFLAYLVKCAVTGKPYTVFGYKGKQVRDNIHSGDLVRCFWEFLRQPRSGVVYNIGGGRHSNCSMLEAIALTERLAGRRLEHRLVDEARIGDHIWWISDVRAFQRDYPGWSYCYDLETMVREIVEATVDRHT